MERNVTPVEYGTRTVYNAVAGVAGQNIAAWHYETVLWGTTVIRLRGSSVPNLKGVQFI